MPRAKYYRQRPASYNAYQKEWATANRESVRLRARINYRKVRERVIAKYGGHCSCIDCNVSQYEFLAIDHIYGGGTKERKEKFPNAQSFYAYLDKSPRDSRYQLLCHNCNSAKGYYGQCPHERNKCQ